MTNRLIFPLCLLLFFAFLAPAHGDVAWGVISDFQDGTTQGWDGGTVVNVADSGPNGVGDNSLQLSNGGGGNFAMFNMGVNGVISPSVNAISADLLRPSGQGSAEIRLVMFDTSNNRWTSTVAANVVDDGTWNRYTFSILENDLTQVNGSGSYTNLVNNLERIMFRHDPGAPSWGGSPLAGTMNFDNISAIPEPSSTLIVFAVSFAAVLRRRY